MDGVTSEVAIATNFLIEASPLSYVHHVYAHLYEAKECFPCLLQTFQIAMTICITTASAERSFSSLQTLKNYHRSTMSQERLNNLSLIHIEGDLSGILWDKLEEIVFKFAQCHKKLSFSSSLFILFHLPHILSLIITTPIIGALNVTFHCIVYV